MTAPRAPWFDALRRTAEAQRHSAGDVHGVSVKPSQLLAVLDIADAVENLIDDVDEVRAKDLRLHDLEQRLGAIFLGFGGGHNHEDDLRAALGASA